MAKKKSDDFVEELLEKLEYKIKELRGHINNITISPSTKKIHQKKLDKLCPIYNELLKEVEVKEVEGNQDD